MRKLILTAASVLAFGFAGYGVGFATPAAAAGTGSATESGAGSATASGTGSAATMSPGQIEQAQRQLKSEGLYNGEVNGQMDAATKTALAEFQKKHNLPQTGTLDEATLDKLTTGGTTGSGSSMPSGETGTTGATGAGGTSTMTK